MPTRCSPGKSPKAVATWAAEQIAAARAAGIDDAKIIEVIAHVASQTLTNYLNNLALTEIDFPAIDA